MLYVVTSTNLGYAWWLQTRISLYLEKVNKGGKNDNMLKDMKLLKGG